MKNKISLELIVNLFKAVITIQISLFTICIVFSLLGTPIFIYFLFAHFFLFVVFNAIMCSIAEYGRIYKFEPYRNIYFKHRYLKDIIIFNTAKAYNDTLTVTYYRRTWISLASALLNLLYVLVIILLKYPYMIG